MSRGIETIRRVPAGAVRSARSWGSRLQLSTRAMWLLVLAATAMVGAAVVALGLGEDVTQHNGAASSDPQHLRLFVDHRPSWLVSAAKAVTTLGAVPVLGVLAVLAGVALWWRGQRLLVAVAPGLALGCTGVVVAAAKHVVDRARPDLTVRLLADSEPSFPSGHAADSAALFVTLAIVVAAVVLRRPAARALTVAAALLASGVVGLSRLVLAVHWPTDVVAGWALGLAIGIATSTVVALAARMRPPDVDQGHLRARAVSILFARRAGRDLESFAA